jgi:Domain of unknown function (DUF4276)
LILHIEFLVEDLSTQEALNNILPKILAPNISYKVHSFQGKPDLISKLPSRLNGYRNWIPDDYRIVILLDRDDEDCLLLKQKLEKIVTKVGLITKPSVSSTQSFQVLIRLAIEEVEAWFFGDIQAITQAYSKVSSNLASQAKYRDPDAIRGGTWETLERILQRAGYHQGGLEKVKAARDISLHMNPEQNRSKSFQVFYSGLLNICQTS